MTEDVPVVLSYEQTRLLIGQVIEESALGRYTLAGCQYVETNEAHPDGPLVPCCVVGHLFVKKFGVNPEDLIPVNTKRVTELPGEGFDMPVWFDWEARSYISMLQDAQDDGFDWGTADERAAQCVADMSR